MARHWYTMDDALLAAQRLGPEEFCALHPEPVLVVGTVTPGTLQRDPGDADPNATLRHKEDPKALRARGASRRSSGGRYLVVRKSSRTGRIRRGAVLWVTIGRTAENDVVVNDHTVSRQHARMRRNDERNGWLLEDLDSKNLTHLDGTLLQAGTPVTIESGQVVRLGRLDFTLLRPADFHTYLRSS